MLISAGAIEGKLVTCHLGIRDDIRAAGAAYQDDAAIVDGNLLTGRGADDLPAFCRKLVELLNATAKIN